MTAQQTIAGGRLLLASARWVAALLAAVTETKTGACLQRMNLGYAGMHNVS